MPKPMIFRTADSDCPWLLFKETDDFGLRAYELARPPARFWAQENGAPQPFRTHVDAARSTPEPSPVDLLSGLIPGDNWHAMTKRSLDRLLAWFLISEDPQHRLDAQPVSTLAHQASLVHHVLQEPHLQSVLIADEVGLGKTVEAALIVKKLLERQRGLRVLYLAPARLVSNVARELDRLELPFRMWVAGSQNTGRLTDALVVASIHRAVGGPHYNELIAQRWDVVIVDECHHLSAWSDGGQSATGKYKLVDDIRRRLGPTGRLILMSGTPHQGHADRFSNVLRLLQRDNEGKGAVAGRVIYRTKEDVRDWDGNPLFPRRQVRKPVVLDLGAEHRAWLERIHHLFEPATDVAGPEAHRRAAGWRTGQALQWATSSIEAGLGYLVRQAIRAGWDERRAALRSALAALRPYRHGPRDEKIDVLLSRIRAEIRYQEESGDDVEIEEFGEDQWRPDEGVLAEVLEMGLSLLSSARDAKWKVIEERVLADAGGEKVVLFAQPIETVIALAQYLERAVGSRPALIIGGQKEDERQREIDAFRRADGPQFLVSSRAGGEGINLQVARRIVHVDVPWNPMEMEQRVGRVHRFMSRRTILVDTVVVKDSREQHMYEVARTKLRDIAKAFSLDDERFESLFIRVMALVQPEDLQGVLAEGALGPFSEAARLELAQLVQRGFDSWQDFHNKFAKRERQISGLDPGLAKWDDLADLARTHLRAQDVEGYQALGFEFRDGEVADAPRPARVLRVGDIPFACGDYAGAPVLDSEGRTAGQLGLNVPMVTKVLRELAFPAAPCGAAHVRWPEGRELPERMTRPALVMVLARMSLRFVGLAPEELEVRLRCFVGPSDTAPHELVDGAREALLRGLFASTVRREPEESGVLVGWASAHLDPLVESLRRPDAADRERGTYHVVVPLLAAVVA
jgi:superfamily II DNA or RNA helicase